MTKKEIADRDAAFAAANKGIKKTFGKSWERGCERDTDTRDAVSVCAHDWTTKISKQAGYRK